MSQLKRYNGTSWETVGGSITTTDALPVGSEVNYNGSVAPTGWQEVDDPNTYSTTETRIGSWINGKPLYRKIFTDTMPNSGSSKSISLSSYSVEEYFIEWAFIKYGNRRFQIPFVDGGGTKATVSIDNVKNIVINNMISDINEQTIIISLLYTKTTD